MSVRSTSLIVVVLFSAASIFVITPQFVYAAFGQANEQCIPVVDEKCPCTQNWFCDKKGCGCKGPIKNKWMCKCVDTTANGVTTGHCVMGSICHGDSNSSDTGQQGGGLGMEQLMSAMKGIMDALKGGGGGGGGGGDSGGGMGSQGCTTFYQTSIQGNPDPCSYYVPSPLDFTIPGGTTTLPGLTCTTYTPTAVQNDPTPCTFYVPGGATGSDACASYTATAIINDPTPCKFYSPLAGNNAGSNTAGSGKSSTTVNVFVNAAAQGPAFFSNILNSISGMGGGGGDIDVRDSGATIYAGNADTKTNSGIAGFFGGDATNGQTGSGIITRLCISRPWAGALLSILIPPTFFDTLCKLRGYQVGSTPPPPVKTVSQTVTPTRYTPPPATIKGSAQTVAPQADIWAVPLRVPIGARTSIFWSSKGVKSCTVSSPDGNFHETALSGGGSTVPIVTATTFTISCIAHDDSHVTNSVTVYLKI